MKLATSFTALLAVGLLAAAAPAAPLGNPGAVDQQPAATEAAPGETAAPGRPARAAAAQPYFDDLFVPYESARPSVVAPNPEVTGTPVPSAEVQREFDRLVSGMIDPENTLDIVVNRPRVLVLEETPLRVQIPNEDVASYVIISENELSVQGNQPGTTLLNIWFPNPENPRRPRVLSYLVRVVGDPHAQNTELLAFQELERQVNLAFPESRITLTPVGQNLIVRGDAKSITEAANILKVIESNTEIGASEGEGVRVDLSELIASEGADTLFDVVVPKNKNIINLMRVAGAPQVMLRVTIAEVSRAASRTLGMNWEFVDNEGDFTIAQLTGNIMDSANIPLSYVDGYQYRVAINALRGIQLARSLAEPNLTTLNGKTASFNAGGQFPVPIVTGATATGLQGVEFEDYGIQLNFTPFILDDGRIRMRIEFEASTRQLDAGTTINNSSVPGLETRNFSSTVEMRQGQTLAVAGLAQSSFGATRQGIPLLSDLPLVGFVFGNNTTSSSEQELVLLVTPEIVTPLERHEVPPLPGADMFEPSDLEFYLLNKLESTYMADWRSQARTDFVRGLAGRQYPNRVPPQEQAFQQMRRAETILLVGPTGHSDSGTR